MVPMLSYENLEDRNIAIFTYLGIFTYLAYQNSNPNFEKGGSEKK